MRVEAKPTNYKNSRFIFAIELIYATRSIIILLSLGFLSRVSTPQLSSPPFIKHALPLLALTASPIPGAIQATGLSLATEEDVRRTGLQNLGGFRGNEVSYEGHWAGEDPAGRSLRPLGSV